MPKCEACDDTGWVLNKYPWGEVVWAPLLNDSLPCEQCDALRKRHEAEMEVLSPGWAARRRARKNA